MAHLHCRGPVACLHDAVTRSLRHLETSSCCNAAASALPRRGRGRDGMPNGVRARLGGRQQVENGGTGVACTLVRTTRRRGLRSSDVQLFL